MLHTTRVLRVLAGLAVVVVAYGSTTNALAQTTSGNSGTGASLWSSKGCGGCHAQTAAPINAANAGGHILFAIANGMPAAATPAEANDLAAYLGTFLSVPATVSVNQNSAPTSFSLPQLFLNTTRGQYTGIAIVTPPTRGTVTVSGTTATYTPNTGQSGADSFTYRAITAAGCTGSCSSTRSQSINIVVPNPANNNFASRAPLSGNAANLTATNAGTTTKEAGEPAHAGNAGGKSVWWTWTAPFTNAVTIQTSGSNFNTLLAVYTGNAVNALTLVASNDNCGASRTPANTSKVSFTATAGVTYQIAVDGFNAGIGAASGSIVLDLFQVPVVPNDNFANATVIPPGTFGASGDNTYATFEAGEPDIFGNRRTLWWRWTAPTTAIYRLAMSGSTVNTRAGVYTGNSLTALTQVSFGTDLAYNMFSGGLYPTATFLANAGTEYRIQIDDTATQGGFIYFSLDKPGNDNFTQGLTVFGNEVHLIDSNVGSTVEGNEPLSFELYTVWFKWTAPSTAPVTIDTCGSAFKSLIGVYTLPPFTFPLPSSIGSLQPVPNGFGQPLCPDPKNYASQFTAVAGQRYYIQVGTAVAFLTPPTPDNNPGIYHLNISQAPSVSYTGNAASRKVHGAAGPINLPLNAQPIGGNIVIEPRGIGGGHTIAFAFSGTVYAVGAVTVVDAAGAPVGNASAAYSGNEVLVSLSGIAEAQRVTVIVNGVNGVASAAVSLGFLAGDTGGTGTVSAADIASIKARRGQPVPASYNFRFDLNANGVIDEADVVLAKARSGARLP
jgi:hypothetical protein